MHVCVHTVFLDGVYTGFDSRHPLRFHQATHLTDAEVEWMVRHIQALIFGHLRRRGYLDEEAALVAESEPELELDELATYHAAAVQGLIPFGQREGQQATLFGEPVPALPPRPRKKLCADYEGYSLHAAVRIGTGTGSRERLERLGRYICRPAFAQDRLSVARDGSIVYRFRKPWRNGKLAVVMDPMTFLSRLAAQVPPPRFHVMSYFGVLAAAASRRDEIVPGHDMADGAEPESISCAWFETSCGFGQSSCRQQQGQATTPRKDAMGRACATGVPDGNPALPVVGNRLPTSFMRSRT